MLTKFFEMSEIITSHSFIPHFVRETWQCL